MRQIGKRGKTFFFSKYRPKSECKYKGVGRIPNSPRPTFSFQPHHWHTRERRASQLYLYNSFHSKGQENNQRGSWWGNQREECVLGFLGLGGRAAGGNWRLEGEQLPSTASHRLMTPRADMRGNGKFESNPDFGLGNKLEGSGGMLLPLITHCSRIAWTDDDRMLYWRREGADLALALVHMFKLVWSRSRSAFTFTTRLESLPPMPCKSSAHSSAGATIIIILGSQMSESVNNEHIEYNYNF